MKPIIISLFVFISINAKAFIVIDYKAMVKYNSAKSHYLVTVPENNESWKGYTAVFDVESKSLVFKVDTYFRDGRIFLSEDGQRLFMVYTFAYDGNEQCTITTIHKTGEKQTYTIFNRLITPKLISSYTNVVDLYSQNNGVVIESADSIYRFSTETLKTAASKRESEFDPGKINQKFDAGFFSPDTLFSLKKLSVNGKNITDLLLQDKELSGSGFTVELEVILTSSGSSEIQRIYVHRESASKESKDKSIALRSKILTLLKSYKFDTLGIPEGLDYWYFQGTIKFKN